MTYCVSFHCVFPPDGGDVNVTCCSLQGWSPAMPVSVGTIQTTSDKGRLPARNAITCASGIIPSPAEEMGESSSSTVSLEHRHPSTPHSLPWVIKH